MRIIYVILFVLGFVSLNAQNDDDYFNPNDPVLKNDVENTTINLNTNSKPKLKYNLTAGTSIGSGLNGGSAINTYVAPSIIYPVNNKLSVEAGVMYNKGFYNNYGTYNFFGENAGINKINGNTDQLFFYTRARYKLTEKLTITGSAYKSTVINNNSNIEGVKTNPNAFNFENSGYSLGFIYKMSEHSSLEFHMNYNKGASPYYSPLGNTSPFNNSGMRFHNSPFEM